MKLGMQVLDGMSLGPNIGFTPSGLPNLQLWFDASVSSSLFQDSGLTTPASADGDPVGGWKDQSSNAYNMTQATSGKRGTLKLNVYNGKPAVRFDGVSQYIDIAHASAGNMDTNTYTIFYVLATQDRTKAAQGIYNTFDSGGSNCKGGPYWYNVSGNARQKCYNSGTSPAIVNGTIDMTTNNAAHQGTMQRDNSGLTYSIWLDASNDNVAVSYTGSPTAWSSCGNPAIGRPGSYNGDYFQGDVCELIIYSDAKGTTDRQTVQSYLKSKWGTP